MTPLLLTLASLAPFPLFHSSNRYTPPLTVAAALIEMGDVTVALSGQGADELVGGYRKHEAAAIAGAFGRLPRPLRSLGIGLARRGPKRLGRPIETLSARDPVERDLAMSRHLTDEFKAEIVRGPLAALDGRTAHRAIRACLNGFPDDPALA